MGKIRGTHSSPGIYSQITDLSYAAKTLGVTTLGLVGETLKGPAFEPIKIADYTQFQDYFGGCSAERFKDSLYPKYELPYIAKEYLTKSDQLYVCRVLGLSGYNAGPAFVLTAEKEPVSGETADKYVIGILRSRGSYVKYANIGDECNPVSKYDHLVFDCDKVELKPYTNVSVITRCDDKPVVSGETETEIKINALNYGQFTLVPKKFVGVGSPLADPEGYVALTELPVSLNAGTKDYIYNVLGSKPTEGDAALFIEELYDLKLKELIESGKVTKISATVTKLPELIINPVTNPVSDFVTIPETSLKRKDLGTSFVCAEEGDITTGSTYNGFTYHLTNEKGEVITSATTMNVGEIYKVSVLLDKETGAKQYVYVQSKDKDNQPISVGYIESGVTANTVNTVKVLAYDAFVAKRDVEIGGVQFTELFPLNDLSNYHEQFRCASTPWFVSEIKGDGKNLQVKKLFRFHTISDGTEANTQVKISITNIKPDNGAFDVLVRDFNDSDANVKILESYKGVTMVPGDSKYIALQIGTIDGAYEIKSKYVMVEVIENNMTKNCVPCGFLGYPVRDFSEQNLIAPTLTYNTIYDEDIKNKRQYFGMSDITGVDTDILLYKGKNAYTEEYTIGYTNPFHLDSTLHPDVIGKLSGVTITIDGDERTAGITWDAVSPDNKLDSTDVPAIIGTEQEMEDTIYKDVNLRKFTACFYGAFDGWDIYRNSRTNTDEFKANKYKGTITNGYGQTFSKIQDGTNLALDTNAITSDYYAYLAGANQFEIREKHIINLFATPGIDYVNNTSLVNDVLDMIEEKRGADALYIVTTPDKPWGTTDAVDEMYSSKDASENLEDTSIDTYMAATYYPWVKFFDNENNMFIQLPATKDVLRNMADVDNKKYPWIAPAGIERGKVNCRKMHFFAKLEDEDNVYDGRINPLKTFSKDGVIVWGNKTMYSQDTPMNRINVVRLMIYMKRLIEEATRKLIFEPNDTTLVAQFDSIVRPILTQIKTDRGITDFELTESQTVEQMDAHEMSATIWVKPTPTLEYIEINYVVTPQGVDFSIA